ncbi:helix-turn-helix transcriptional regulator [Streptomyces sp. NPDC048442]|uniref:helix-turn-helix domain-containing protein n=1 Tax=Streptomyces sp. NPDC048442 TaxID=3154823 RepID=UPI00342CAE84
MADDIGTTTRDPSTPAEFFGLEVEELRKSMGLSQEEFAPRVNYQQPYISKVESGSVLASEAFAFALDRAAGTPGVYARLRDRLSKRGHPTWFVPYIELERAANAVTDYSCTFLMGLLQTPEYAEAVFRAAHPRWDASEIKASVETRMLRREVLAREEPPLLWVIIHEGVLRALVGGRDVMADQLRFLARQAELPNVTLQVFPFKEGAAPSHLPFTLVETPGNGCSVYTETPTQGGQVEDAPKVVATARATFDHLRMAALSEGESLAMIRKITEEHDR